MVGDWVGSEVIGAEGGPGVSYGSQSPHFAQCLGKAWLSLSQVQVQIEEAWDVKHRGRVGLLVGPGVVGDGVGLGVGERVGERVGSEVVGAGVVGAQTRWLLSPQPLPRLMSWVHHEPHIPLSFAAAAAVL